MIICIARNNVKETLHPTLKTGQMSDTPGQHTYNALPQGHHSARSLKIEQTLLCCWRCEGSWP